MRKHEFSEIREKLKDKNIYLISYCHADHSWMHTRDWHKRRYLAVLEKAVALLKKRKDFKYFIDSWSELLKPCLEKRPELIPFMRKMFKAERLALGGGHWSNLRFAHIPDETTVRNMILGRRTVKKIFPEARLDAYANLDVGIGHSQLPQLLKMADYKFYFAWRPQKGMDEQGVPRSFIWAGLSGDKVMVTRHSYGGWFHAEEFYDKKGQPTDFNSQKVEFDFVVKYAWKQFLKTPALQPGLKTLSFCQGGDDAMPNTDAFNGKDRDIFSIIANWNAAGLGYLQYGTPYDVFDALSKQKLPEWEGLLDPCEMGYHVARNGSKSIRALRDAADRELLLAEQLAAKAALHGFNYPESEFDRLWKEQLTFCTHAVEYLFPKDFNEARRTLENVIADAGKIQEKALDNILKDTDKNDPDSFAIYNPVPEKRREFVVIDVPNIFNSRKKPVLKDGGGKELPAQVLFVGPLSRYFHVLVEKELAPCSAVQVNIGWSEKEVKLPGPETLNLMNAEVDNGILKVVFKNGRLINAENRKTGNTISAVKNAGLLEPLSLPQEVQCWMPVKFADNPEPYIPQSLQLEEKGPLRFRIVRRGQSGPHFFRQTFDLYRGKDEIQVKTIVDIVPDSTNIAIGNPVPTGAKTNVDIPFGVEARDLAKIKYGHLGEGNYENIERIIPGIFWGRSWVFAESGKNSFGLISMDGPKYFRRYGSPERILHLLACVKPYREEGWVKFIPAQRVLGRNEFNHVLVLAGGSYQESDMVRRAEFARSKIIVTPGKAQAKDKPLSISPQCVRLSAFCQEGNRFILRIVNMNAKSVTATIRMPLSIKSAEACNFLGKRLKDLHLSYKKDRGKIRLSSWQIASLKLSA